MRRACVGQIFLTQASGHNRLLSKIFQTVLKYYTNMISKPEIEKSESYVGLYNNNSEIVLKCFNLHLQMVARNNTKRAQQDK